MRYVKTISTMLLAGVTYLACLADPGNEPPQQNQSEPIQLEQKFREAPNKRPKMPGRQIVTCQYDGEYLLLNFVLPEGNALLKVESGNVEPLCYDIFTDNMTVEIKTGHLEYPISIELDTELGNSFSGVLE